MIEVVDDTMRPFGPIHLADLKDRPLCGARPEAAYVVEQMRHVSCPACVVMSNVPRPRRGDPGSA